MSAYGMPHEQIATQIGLRSAKTLRRHFRQELDRGMIEANAQVAQTLFKMAPSDNNTTATIFWMKARAGWRDGQEFDQRPQAAAPFVVTVEKKIE